MRGMILACLLVLVACNEGSTRVVRWPEHRHRHDDQLEQLQAVVEAQRKDIAELKARILQLESAAQGTLVKVDTAPRP